MESQDEFMDLKTGKQRTMLFFMIDSFLRSRIDINKETDGDEEVNVYMAHLLFSMVDGRLFSEQAGKLAITPADVFLKAEQEDFPSRKFQVYRANADHRLVFYCIFCGTGEHQSLYREQFTLPESYIEEAQTYYGRAALAARRLPARYQGLALAINKIAANFDTYRAILTHMSGNYLNLHCQITPGQLFHLQCEANKVTSPEIKKIALDYMLDAYNAWQVNPTPESEAKYRQACEQYRQTNPAFNPNQPWSKLHG